MPLNRFLTSLLSFVSICLTLVLEYRFRLSTIQSVGLLMLLLLLCFLIEQFLFRNLAKNVHPQTVVLTYAGTLLFGMIAVNLLTQ
ncbi:hypothetical protein [Exiguobacterium flavidum]|uniref:hypothetical protein n=1 Tax=Exiguobacterium flavidum TaxID=2184695 RepID=UPI000DF830EA|nr:hypothetical protein [Exiguobacterium flavidum]